MSDSGNNKNQLEKNNDYYYSESKLQSEWLDVQAAQENAERFEVLYDRYYTSVFKFIYRRTSDEILAADICSIVFLKALEKLHSYEFKGVPFGAWLFRIASNEVGQFFRRQKKERVVSVEQRQIPDLTEELDLKYTEEIRQVLFEVLDDLKENHLQLIELRFFEQRPFKEIAAIMDITESNAKVKTYRILERMKNKILLRAKNT